MADYENYFHRISKGLYRGVSDVVGTRYKVKMLQQVYYFQSALEKCTYRQYEQITSGSTAEGFCFNTSDYDAMYVDKRVIVVNSITDHLLSSLKFPSVLLMDTENTSPGFTLLQCLSFDQRNMEIVNALVFRGLNMFVNSRIIRESFMKSPASVINGPCSSGTLPTGYEFDLVYTLRCPFLPPQAKPFIQRSVRSGWPGCDVLTNLLKEGCLLVPINSKQQSYNDQNDLEWRISFSLAEKTLVCSMNHTQFLCYGLSKLFLNEVLTSISQIKGLLCSYFMKTAIFWEISETTDAWTPWNLMFKFWEVFRRIIKWVSQGYCPNFFIPEHNMFNGKIYGAAQRILTTRLRALYEEGYLCLLRITSLKENLSLLIENPDFSDHLSIDEEDYVPIQRIESEKLTMICFSHLVPVLNYGYGVIRELDELAALSPTSEDMASVLKLRVNFLMQKLAILFMIAPIMPSLGYLQNKVRNEYIRHAKAMFRKAQTNLCFSEIYHASCAYINGNYMKTIRIVNGLRQRLKRHRFMYFWCPDEDLVLDCRQFGMSYESIINNFVLRLFLYDPAICIEELQLESFSSFQNTGCTLLLIQPVVFFHLLLILCFIRLNQPHCAKHVLCELETLLYYEGDYYIHPVLNIATSWEILGICQQLCGDHRSAFKSYIFALYNQSNVFKQATFTRINSLFSP